MRLKIYCVRWLRNRSGSGAGRWVDSGNKITPASDDDDDNHHELEGSEGDSGEE